MYRTLILLLLSLLAGCGRSPDQPPPNPSPQSTAETSTPITAMTTTGVQFRYNVTDLGSLGGISHPNGINNAGQVVGRAQVNNTKNVWHAFLWQAGKGMQDLGTLGGKGSEACGINDAGQIVGKAGTDDNFFPPGNPHAFLWQPGHDMQDLGTLGGKTSQACGINNLGQIVGLADIGNVSQSDRPHTFLWQVDRGMQDIGTFGEWWPCGRAINGIGQVIGVGSAPPERIPVQSGDSSVYYSVLWQAGTRLQRLGTLGGKSSVANGINNNGQIVGNADTGSGKQHAFLWQAGKGMQDLGTLTGRLIYSGPGVRAITIDGRETLDLGTLTGGDSVALGINNKAQVVGVASTSVDRSPPGELRCPGNAAAFLYSDGKMTNLNTMIDPASGWLLEQATAINDSGQIVGIGTNQGGDMHAFLLTPVPSASVTSDGNPSP